MTEEELLGRLECKPVPACDLDGKPIPQLAGLLLKPMDVEDSIKVRQFEKENGKGTAGAMFFVRGVINPDGSRVLSDESAIKLMKSLVGPVSDAVAKIRQLSGEDMTALVDGAEGDEKKTNTPTPSTNGHNSSSSSGLPVTSGELLPNS